MPMLKSVTSYFGSQLVRRYYLKYENSANTKKSRLISIREAATGGAYPATTFTWNNVSNSLVLTPSVAAGGQQDQTHWIQGDFDGDGLVDMVRARSNNIQIFKVASGSLVAGGSATSTQTFKNPDTWLQGDFDSDGKLDIVRVWAPNNGDNTRITTFKNTGSSGTNAFTESTQTPTNAFQPWKMFMALDANGDGRLDIVCINRMDGTNNAALNIKVYVNNAGTFTVQDWTPTGSDTNKQNDRWLAGDFNADGLTDLVKIYKDGNFHSVRVYLNQAYATPKFAFADWVVQRSRFFKADGTTIAYNWITGDFNGDGLTDLATVPKPNTPENSTTVEVYLSKGSTAAKFAIQSWMSSLTVSDNSDLQVGDYNADGRSDILVLRADNDGGSYYKLKRRQFFSNGAAFYEPVGEIPDDVTRVRSDATPVLKKWYAADFNGDGKEDLIHNLTIRDNGQSNPDQTIFNIYRSTPGFQDLLTDVTDGMAVKTSVDYQPLTGVNGVSVFTKSTGSVWPVVDLIVPMPVVASITYDNGLGAPGSSTYSVKYKYEGLKADAKRGMLGFSAVEAIDSRGVNNPNPANPPNDTIDSTLALHTKSFLKQGFPYTGMVERAISYLAAPTATKSISDSTGLLSLTTTTYAAGPTENAKIFFPYAQNSRVLSWELNGTQSGVQKSDTETIAQQVDVYGNTVISVVKTKNLPASDFFIKTTTSTYSASPDLTKWRIGQVIGSSVTHEAPGQETVTRTSGFSYDSSNGQVGSETVQPGGTNWVSTGYEYDSFGNTKKAITTGNDMTPASTSRITETIHDLQGRFLATTVNPLLHAETKEYDPRFGAVTNVTGPNGLTDTALYDGFSRQARRSLPPRSTTPWIGSAKFRSLPSTSSMGSKRMSRR